MHRFPLLLLCIALLCACQAQQKQQALAHVFQPLDGRWKGVFTVYTDTLGQREAPVQPRELSLELLQSLPLKVSQRIEVEQVYTSETPFFQRVHITDTYLLPDGSRQVVESSGYNEVKRGKLICVVNKPDEKVVHQGSSLPGNVIVWERNLRSPTKIEYFYEQVDQQHYTIIGWGYYGQDNPNLSPRTWFYGQYTRQ
ncbi:MAG: hypothetical protein D6730_12005 [Bacteroidetes bacterium]|nr:MAG: hypothetical protein D6730_12005 [Bacteroidota bacterium]